MSDVGVLTLRIGGGGGGGFLCAGTIVGVVNCKASVYNSSSDEEGEERGVSVDISNGLAGVSRQHVFGSVDTVRVF